MAKDPAFLFYPGDWMTGTMVLSRHLKGCYIDLLIAQFNNGPLSLESIKAVLGIDQASWTVLSKKFQQDSYGNYYNERLATEIEKRKAFTESRKKNGVNGGRPPNKPYVKPYANHMGNLPENINKNEEGEKGVGKGEGFLVSSLPMSTELTAIEVDSTKEYISIVRQKNLTDQEIKNYWKAFKINNFSKERWYNSRQELLSHFRDSLKLQLSSTENGKEKIQDRPTSPALKYGHNV